MADHRSSSPEIPVSNGRLILSEGDKTDADSSYASVTEIAGQVHAHIRSSYDPDDDLQDEHSTCVGSDEFLNALAKARLGRTVRLAPHGTNPQTVLSFYDSGSIKQLGIRKVTNPWPTVSGSEVTIYHSIDFDALFLDSFSVIENGELRKRQSRDIAPSAVEQAILDIVAKSPEVLHSFEPRAFEVFVASMLSSLGFSRVQLSRFVKDGGYDIFVVYCVGDEEYSAVAEVKHYRERRVGIEIVDRLNGVRDRMGAEQAVVFTSSSYSSVAKSTYRSSSHVVALIDYERITELLGRSDRWRITPSSLWTTPIAKAEEP